MIRLENCAIFFAGVLLGTWPGLLWADAPRTTPEIVISVGAQELQVVKAEQIVAKFPISTSRFGLGDDLRSYKTPVGIFEICAKTGGNLPEGAVLKGGSFTGEVLLPNAPGRDPIVTRMIRLRGTEPQNRHALERGIFIHGTPEEQRIGKPVSWGCIRMRSKDVVQLYKQVQVGTRVVIRAPDRPQRSGFSAWIAKWFSFTPSSHPARIITPPAKDQPTKILTIADASKAPAASHPNKETASTTSEQPPKNVPTVDEPKAPAADHPSKVAAPSASEASPKIIPTVDEPKAPAADHPSKVATPSASEASPKIIPKADEPKAPVNPPVKNIAPATKEQPPKSIPPVGEPKAPARQPSKVATPSTKEQPAKSASTAVETKAPANRSDKAMAASTKGPPAKPSTTTTGGAKTPVSHPAKVIAATTKDQTSKFIMSTDGTIYLTE